MGIRASYQSNVLAIYISREELDSLLDNGTVECSLWLGKLPMYEEGVHVFLEQPVLDALRLGVFRERETIAAAKRERLGSPAKAKKGE